MEEAPTSHRTALRFVAPSRVPSFSRSRLALPNSYRNACGRAAGGLLDRDDDLEVGTRLLRRRCEDLVSGSVIAEPDTSSFSITEADVDHVFVGEQKLADVARGDPPQKSALWRQEVLLGSPCGDAKYGRRGLLDRVVSLPPSQPKRPRTTAVPMRVALLRTTMFDGGEQQIVPPGNDVWTLAEGPRRYRPRSRRS